MDIDALYKYLKLVTPNNLKVIKCDNTVDVGIDPSNIFGKLYADSFWIEGNFIMVSTLSDTLPDYIGKIFRKSKPYRKTDEWCSTYAFKIPNELRDLNESTES